VAQNSIILKDKLIHELGEHPNVRAIRGKGYMLGIELDRPASDLRLTALEHNLLLNVTADSVIRLLPALIISLDEIGELVKRLVKTINQFVSQ